MYRDLPMFQRLDRIGELLAKGIYLHMKKEKEAKVSRSEKKETASSVANELLPV